MTGTQGGVFEGKAKLIPLSSEDLKVLFSKHLFIHPARGEIQILLGLKLNMCLGGVPLVVLLLVSFYLFLCLVLGL